MENLNDQLERKKVVKEGVKRAERERKKKVKKKKGIIKCIVN